MYRIILFIFGLLAGYIHYANAQLIETPFDKIRENTRVYTAQAKVSRQTICMERTATGPDGKETIKLDTAEIWDYDKNGRVIKIIRFYYGGYRRILSKYDSLGRKTWEATYDGESNFPFGGSVTTWTYDGEDYKVIEKDGPYAHVVLKKVPNEDRYLEHGKLTGITKESFNAAARTHTSVSLDAEGKQKSRYETVVDNQGRPLEQRTFYNDSSLVSINRYKYDRNDNIIEDTYILQADRTGNKYLKQYNNQKLVVKMTMHLLTGRTLQTQRYFYEYHK